MPSQVLIVGSGISGLTAALKISEKLRDLVKVQLVCKASPSEGATRYAQGGIAGVWSEQDSFELHAEDTVRAGAGLCRSEVVEVCVREGPERIRELIALGVPFTRFENKDFDLHQEGGHRERRILHSDDLTGLAIEEVLLREVRERRNIEILENHIAVDLITEGKLLSPWRKPGRCLGAYVLNAGTGEIRACRSEATVLATGGAGKVYLYTTNPDVCTGDGIAMAYRAGARVANMEFMQFHPTCLYHPEAKNFLITEALRGEGARLLSMKGEAFPAGALATRDVVARAIDQQMKHCGDKFVYLDATVIGAAKLREKFPNIYQTCLKYGIDITRDPIPVVPAAHYTCGGVLVDLDAQSTVAGLYCVGEAACTGLHGANRLASNSLLEGAVFGHRAAQHILRTVSDIKPTQMDRGIPKWESGMAVELEEQIDIGAVWLEIRTLMWNFVGIVRSESRLQRARRRLDLIKAEVSEYYWDYLLTKDIVELRNLCTVAELMVQSALWRKESRGLHFMVDYPERDDGFFNRDTVL